MNMDMTPNPEGARGDREVNQPSAAKPLGDRPVADREVPLRADGAMAALNAWLDGEAAAPRLANNQLTPEAELWSKISREASARKEVRRPAHVAAQIMNALPPATATRLVAAPALQGEAQLVARAVPAQASEGIVMQPAAIALLAVVFLALGAVIAKML
ncbi:MAG TPA: hypothetical protein VE861_10525 [Gemmatimonadaceae bacterium]|nr:hypothetical protein [Gemmatimonadaceae bacterium]